MNWAQAKEFLISENAPSVFVELLPILSDLLPKGVIFDNDCWNLIAWVNRPGNAKVLNVRFHKFKNNELKLVVKLYILHKRLTDNLVASSVSSIVYGLAHLDTTIGVKPLSNLSNGDFYETEKYISNKLKRGAPFRTAGYFQTFGKWLNLRLGYRISYKNSLKNPSFHGMYSSEDSKADKLIDTRVLGNLLAKNADSSISEKDKFFISTLAIEIATGFRINELHTMPKECVEEDGDFRIKYFPEKTYRLGTKFLATGFVPAVKEAISHITTITEDARLCARGLRQNDTSEPNIDWSRTIADDNAFRYFTQVFIEEWLSEPKHNLYNTSGAWSDARQCYIDVLGVIARNNGNVSATARELGFCRRTIDRLKNQQLAVMSGNLPGTTTFGKVRRSWDTDTRVMSFMQLEQHIGLSLNQKQRKLVRDLIKSAQQHQLKKTKPKPLKRDFDLEQHYQFRVTPVVIGDNGKPVLWPDEALFISLKNQFSETHSTKEHQYTLITDSSFSKWLNGVARSKETGNHEDSCFERLGIVDPKTGNTAKFTSHDIRHWLSTVYEQGGLSEQLISLIFNRDPNSNHTYDQTPIARRVDILREAIEQGRTFGHMEETYQRLIAEGSRELAEEYLRSSTLMATLMPHGQCTLNWMLAPCPHSLSCLAAHEQAQGGPCNHLHVDLDDKDQVRELERMRDDAEVATDLMPQTAPQHHHFTTVKINIDSILNRSKSKKKNNA